MGQETRESQRFRFLTSSLNFSVNSQLYKALLGAEWLSHRTAPEKLCLPQSIQTLLPVNPELVINFLQCVMCCAHGGWPCPGLCSGSSLGSAGRQVSRAPRQPRSGACSRPGPARSQTHEEHL